MADPRTMQLDGASRPWWNVPGLNFCSHCLGALPPDVDGACQECGTGTPPLLPPPVVPDAVADFIANARPGDCLDLGVVYRRPPVEPDPPKLSWWQRFANWPNHG